MDRMDPLERLMAIEEIRKLKSRYWHSADTGDWDAFEDILTEDAIWDSRYERIFARGLPAVILPPVADAIAAGDPAVIVGARAVIEFMRKNVSPFVGFHMGGAPIVEVTGPDHGTAIWPFFDHLDNGNVFRGYGHYHDEYRRVGSRWLISRVQMTRICRDKGYGDYPIPLGKD
jgi:hypothetical protein